MSGGFESVASILARIERGELDEFVGLVFRDLRSAYPRELVAEDDRRKHATARAGASLMRSIGYRNMAGRARRSAEAIALYIADVHRFTPEPSIRTTERIGLR